MDGTTSFWVAFAGLVGALTTSFVRFVKDKRKFSIDNRIQNNADVQTIFDGYARIVDELRIEVERLTLIIQSMQLEQEACEQKNALLEKEVELLEARICSLEQKNV